jgi:hypothetical protein
MDFLLHLSEKTKGGILNTYLIYEESLKPCEAALAGR